MSDKPSQLSLKRVPFAVLAVSLLATLYICGGCGKAPQPNSLRLEPTVKVKPVIKKNILINVKLSGTLQSIRNVKIIPRVSGWIDNVNFQDGSFVKEGDLLYQIDPKPFQAALDAATAKLATDKAQYDFWLQQAKRYDTLAKDNVVSKEKMESMEAHAKTYKATMAAAQANVTQAKLNLGYTKVLAPFKGRIQRTLVHKGALVSNQKTVLTQLLVIDPIYIYFNVSRSMDFSMQKYAKQGKLFPLEKMVLSVYLPDGSLYKQTGSIDYFSFLIDPSTDCLQSRGVIENTKFNNIKNDYALIPGQYVPIMITVGQEPNALLVPKTAIVQSQLGATVYVVGTDNKVTERTVKLGLNHQDMRQITEGLKENEQVVVDGVQKVRDGIKVKIANTK